MVVKPAAFLPSSPRLKPSDAHNRARMRERVRDGADGRLILIKARPLLAYIAKYPDGRGSLETPDAYRYRVWDVALKVGRERAWAGNEQMGRFVGFCS